MDNPKGYANPHLLIGPADLKGRLPDILDSANLLARAAWPVPHEGRGGDTVVAEANLSRPLLLDLRPAEAFAAGHIPGAIHFDLFGLSLNDTDPAPLKAFLSMIEHLFAARGVSASRPVVVYDDRSGERSARAFWFLEYFGHPDVRVLDGGFGAWTAAGGEVTTAAQAPVASEWKGARHDDKLATWKDVLARVRQAGSVILDARTDGEYCGTTVRATRGGAIPGAVHVEWVRNLGEDGAFRPAGELRAMYEAAGVTPDREIVSYCQGGYRAANAYLALRLLGYPRLRNYLGSWREWGERSDLPLEDRSRIGGESEERA